MPTALRDVRSQGQSGKHMLALSFSGFDPFATSGGAPCCACQVRRSAPYPLKSPEPMLSTKNAAIFKKTTSTRKEQTSFQKQKLALRDVNSFASSTVFKQGFNGDGAVVSYLENKGDNHETYDNSISLCIRALQHGRTCKDGSSRAERQDPSYVA